MSSIAGHPFVVGSILASALSVGFTNLMLVREGLARGRIITVPAMVVFCYGNLLSLACAFAENVAQCPPDVRSWLSWSAVGIILFFAGRSVRSAARPKASEFTTQVVRESRCHCLSRVALVVLLNPLVYLEVLLAPASICASLGDHAERASFAVGVVCTTAVYCFSYSLGATALACPIHRREDVGLSRGRVSSRACGSGRRGAPSGDALVWVRHWREDLISA